MGKRVMVLGRFRHGKRQSHIRQALLAQGHTLTGSVRQAEVVVAGTRCGHRLEQARQLGLPVVHQDELDTLAAPPAPAAVSPALEAPATAAQALEAPAPAPPRPRPLSSDQRLEALIALANTPPTDESWSAVGRHLDALPAGMEEEAIAAIEGPMQQWPTHRRPTHTDWLTALAEDGVVSPRLRLVGTLYLTDVIKKSPKLAARVLDMRPAHMPHVQQLRINHFKGSNDWLSLLTPARLDGITELNLMYNDLGSKGLETALSAVQRDRLTVLDARANSLGTAGATMLAKAGLHSLRWLHLYQNNIKNKGLAALCGKTALPAMQRLVVSYNHLTSGAISSLAKAPFASNLTGLKIKYNNLFAKGAQKLAGAKTFTRLRHLDISANEIGDDGLIALARSANLPALERLDAEANATAPYITDDGLWVLAETSGMPRLRELHLQGNAVTASGLGALLRSKSRVSLKVLDLLNNNIAADGAAVLTEADLPVQLQKLSISFDDGALSRFCHILRHAAALASVEDLNIRPHWDMEKEPAVTAALLACPHIANLRALQLQDLRFDTATVEALIALPFPHLRRMRFSSPGFSTADLQRLLGAPWMAHLDGLILYEYPDKPDYTALQAFFKDTQTTCSAF